LKVGITGQVGFIGTHLYNFLKYCCKGIELIPFEDDYFKNDGKLSEFVKQCDKIVHLAAMNRHGDPQVIYDTNVKLVKDVIRILEKNNHKPHVYFSSSTQEERDNPYGRSKKVGRKLFEEWANQNGAGFTALIIPNVFGPFGVPFYNSVVSTFSHQLTHSNQPKIEIDAVMKLIYINDLVKKMYEQIIYDNEQVKSVAIDHTAEIKVTDILTKLIEYKKSYMDNNIIPNFATSFEVSLFNTFRSYIGCDHFPVSLDLHSDNRGYLVEVIKTYTNGQTFFSVTKPGITRGNHFHMRKIERFSVIKGEALIKLRRIGTDRVIEYRVSGSHPSFVDMPVFYTHNITNIGTDDAETLFWSSEIYNPEDADTYVENV
jgi:UDP-2-acetamido-2,6-beta-L-arabino-hexul-4-ose reductase